MDQQSFLFFDYKRRLLLKLLQREALQSVSSLRESGCVYETNKPSEYSSPNTFSHDNVSFNFSNNSCS
jgi:hypothetical protein